MSDIQEISGKGISAKVDGHDVLAGNSKLMELNRIAFIDCHSVGTIMHMAIDGEYAGHIVISDVVKPHAKEAIERLKHCLLYTSTTVRVKSITSIFRMSSRCAMRCFRPGSGKPTSAAI